MRAQRGVTLLLVVAVFAGLLAPGRLGAQAADTMAGARVARLVAEPAALVVEAGQSVPFTVTAYDAGGQAVVAPLRLSAPWRSLQVREGDDRPRGLLSGRQALVTGVAAGAHQIVATVFVPGAAQGDALPSVTIPVTVSWPAVARIEITTEPGRLYQGTTLRHRARAFHADGSLRPNPDFRWSSSEPAVASVDRFGNVVAHRAGAVTITAALESARGTVKHVIPRLPAAKLEIAGGAEQARTGDVLSFEARALAASGGPVSDLPLTWSYTFTPDDSIAAPGAAAQMLDGKFVAEVPGLYTILAAAGPLTARRVVDIRPREAVRRATLVGHGRVANVHTSDLWVFEGRDGRDYAITGTWGANGVAYIWDVTDPANIVKTDSIQVDARTVNDVKVSPDARYAALSREGASNRRNGVVILDLSNPAHPTIASVYEQGLTGGVHNMFVTNDYLFALSAGEKYLILDVRDIKNPTYAGEYDHPDSYIHDVWVHDGIAYSSEWGTGVVVVDVGNGHWGGRPDKPVFVTSYAYPVGATHSTFPYAQESTGKFYLFLGDEIMPRVGLAYEGGLSLERYDPATGQGGTPSATSGYIHVVDFTDPARPRDVARYQAREFGTHNIWVEDDVLYQAYYEGGLRVVDVSGELMGNLAEQGREIAVYKPHDPAGYIANAAMVWGPQLYKGHIFFSDFNSGLWSIKLEPPQLKGRATS
ncbi:MAG: Ig-like domain-containing protein [Gemmatimonadetes bacterium]|nr:Ig-like domain-containing protein [Gemmatimonadota bacterium]